MNHEAKYVYRFGSNMSEGDESMRALLGGKGAGLAEMTRLLIPVPPGFTIGTNVCRYYLEHGTLPSGLENEVAKAIRWLEAQVGRRFNDAENPLLVSVRSGAAISMPGMMDTILNVGLTRDGLDGLAAQNGSRRFALDSYRRLLQMFGVTVLHAGKKEFDRVIDAAGKREAVTSDSELPANALEEIVTRMSEIIERTTGRSFPADADEQLSLAIRAVFNSWSSDRAKCYRRLNGIADDLGTAVTVQAMVFGNAGPDSGSGVGFTRNPSTGDRELFGEFLPNAQGEDVVAGTRTPVPIAMLEEEMPELYQDLMAIVLRLEQHYRDAQDFEFTVEKGKLYLLQTRSAKRSALAAVRIAVDMAQEGLISKREALARVKPSSISEILAPQLDFSNDVREPISVGIPASPGAAVGRVVLSADAAVRLTAISGSDPVILVREETMAEDIHGMAAAIGFLTAHGGATSHAAVVARGMGKCCITGAKDIAVVESKNEVRIGPTTLQEGDWISLDASTGRVFAGKMKMGSGGGELPVLDTLFRWAKELQTFELRANADTSQDARAARAAGATGIGLCRTEHMFFAPERLTHMRAMILASNPTERRLALDKLLPIQQHDFECLFHEMLPFPVTIRLLDPPLHEFLPSLDELKDDMARVTGAPDVIERLGMLAARVKALSEINPMMGHRGCRLSITYPEILETQVKAILLAALAVTARDGVTPIPEIMVPLVATAEEMSWLRTKIDEVANQVFADSGQRVAYHVGTMIELPRAAVCAAAIAKHVSFVSFGTNDLTQMTFGFSRDDSVKFLDKYLEQEILDSDPFVTIDQQGVGALIETAILQLRATNPEIRIGVCGEHAGDPTSIRFFASLGVDYISCSPARIPVARLAAAQASTQASVGAEVVVERYLDRELATCSRGANE